MTAHADTIFALSSGAPPAALAIVRISGPHADAALLALIGTLPKPRRATLARMRHPASGELLDEGIVLRFPGPASATGEDLAELHLHGGRAVVAAATTALAEIPGLRVAEPGEFTRRAFENGRIDLAEAEGLADLLEAETEAQRRSALTMAGGALSRKIEEWQQQLIGLAAQVEAVLDFSDEEDAAGGLPADWRTRLVSLSLDIDQWLQRPTVERLKDGIRVVLVGPPNSGKSSLFNAIVGREAAIISAIPGTTRDLIEAPTSIDGTAFVVTDTAGLRESIDEIEAIGIERALRSVEGADLVIWLGEPRDRPGSVPSISVQPKSDLHPASNGEDLRVSAITGDGLPELLAEVRRRTRLLLPQPGEASINRRQRALLMNAATFLKESDSADLLVAAEALRLALRQLNQITGKAGVENMLDALFSRFCIGK